MASSGWFIDVAKRILVVDLESNDLHALEEALRTESMQTLRVSTSDDVVGQWDELRPDAVLLKVRKDESHRNLLSLIRHQPGGDIPVLFFGSAEEQDPIQAPSDAIAHGGDYFFKLPCDVRYLAGRVRGWAERGVRAPQPVDAPVSEAPLLEGFSLGPIAPPAASVASSHPILDRLRVSEGSDFGPSTHEWTWADDGDFSEADIEIDLAGAGLPPEPLAQVEGGVSDEQPFFDDVTTNLMPSEPTDLAEAMADEPLALFEDVSAPPMASEVAEFVETAAPYEEPASPQDLSDARLLAPDARDLDGVGADEQLALMSSNPPKTPFQDRFERLKRVATAAESLPQLDPPPLPQGPQQVSFPVVDSADAQIVTGVRREEAGIAPEDVSRLEEHLVQANELSRPPQQELQKPVEPDAGEHALGQEEPEVLPEVGSSVPAMEAPEPKLEPLPDLSRRLRRSQRRQRLEQAEPASFDNGPLVAAEVDERELAESEEEPATQVFVRARTPRAPTESESLSSLEVTPEAPIGDEEITQGHGKVPVAKEPRGIEVVLEQAELQRSKGNLEQACAGFALAAQMYLDHGRPEATAELQQLISELTPKLATRPPRPSPPDGEQAKVTEDLDLEAHSEHFEAEETVALADVRNSELEDGPNSKLEDEPQATEPSLPLGTLQPSQLNPRMGQLRNPADAVKVLLQAFAQRSTGLLRAPGSSAILLAHGVPAGLVGSDVISTFLRLLADIGRISEGHAARLTGEAMGTPRATAGQLHRQGFLDADEINLLPLRQLENRLVRFLQHRGDWWFEPSIGPYTTHDLTIRTGPIRSWLIDLLIRAIPEVQLRNTLGLGSDTVRVVPGTEHFVADVDAPLTQLLDGRRGLEEAARLAGISVHRALAWAMIWLEEGLAERLHQAVEGLSIAAPKTRLTPDLGQLPMPNLKRERPARVHVESKPPAPNLSLPEVDEPELEDLDDESRVRALAEIVRTRDYFGILDIEPTANRKAIDDAHQRVRRLVPRNVASDLESMVREVLKSVDEARDILMIPELRAAYEHHLEPQ